MSNEQLTGIDTRAFYPLAIERYFARDLREPEKQSGPWIVRSDKGNLPMFLKRDADGHFAWCLDETEAFRFDDPAAATMGTRLWPEDQGKVIPAIK